MAEVRAAYSTIDALTKTIEGLEQRLVDAQLRVEQAEAELEDLRNPPPMPMEAAGELVEPGTCAVCLNNYGES